MLFESESSSETPTGAGEAAASMPTTESPEADATSTAQETADVETVAEAQQGAAAPGSAPTPGEPGYLASEEGSAASTEATSEPEAPAPSRRTLLDELPKGTRIERTRSGFRVMLPEGRAVSGTTFVEAMQTAFPHLLLPRN